MNNREIDALVAEKVMGWRRHSRNTAWLVEAKEVNSVMANPKAWIDDFMPSTRIVDAWQVAEKIKNDNGYFELRVFGDGYKFIIETLGKLRIAIADTAPMAICLAALKAVGEVIK